MSTTARLGIDIVGRDRSRGAFSSTQRSLDAINRSVRTIRAGLAGFAGGNILASVIRSFVEINRTSAPVATAINQMQRAWQAFALQVGEAGLNQGLIDFSKRMGALLISTDGLSQSIGRFLGSGVRILGQIFEGIGRAIAFAYDNGQVFIRVFAAMAAMNIAIRVVSAARAFALLVTALRSASIAAALFHLVSRRALVVWAGAAAIFASATGTLDDLQQAMGWVWQQAEQLIPSIDGGVAAALQRMGFDVKALTTDLTAFEGKLAGLKPLFDDAATAKGNLGKPIDIIPKGIEELPEQMSMLKDSLDIAKGGFSALAVAAGDGKLKMEELRNVVDSLRDQFIRLASEKIFELIINSFLQSPGGGPSGSFGSYFNDFAGGFATGGHLGAGKWGIAGENGPEVIHGPANITPMGRGGGTVVNVINQGGIQSTQSRRRGSDGREYVEIVNRLIEGKVPLLMQKNAPVIGAKAASKRTT
jgi:hypothetical protein